MHLLNLLPLLMSLTSLPSTLAQQQNLGDDTAALTTQTLTMLEPSGSTLIATVTLVSSPTANEPRQEPSPTSQPSAQETTTSEPAITSLLQATRTESYAIPQASSNTNVDENGIDVEAGASGSSSGGFSLSKGGMIAVIVVVVCVAVFGVLSITLFILAKKRQWRVRESIKRASRRLTGRSAGPRPRSEVDRRKRSGVIAGAGGRAGRGGRAPPGTPLVQQKGSAVSETEMQDLEKGDGGRKGGAQDGKGWLRKMRGNDWR